MVSEFFWQTEKLKLLHKNDAQDIEQEQNEHKTIHMHIEPDVWK